MRDHPIELGAVMHRALEKLRNGNWLTRERTRLVCVILIIAAATGMLFLVITAHGMIDRQGRPLGTDFSDVYAAGTFVLDGKPQAPFDPLQQAAREKALFGAATPFYGWLYPPYFLFIAGAVARMPYGVALIVWLAATLFLYVLAIWAILFSSSRFGPNDEARHPILKNERHAGDAPETAHGSRPGALAGADWILLALAFPAVLINVGHGQNGFLTAALLGGALVALDRRPVIAGILFGLLVYKPQFGLVIPLALAFGRHRRAFVAAAVTVVLLTLLTSAVFGSGVWRAFFASTHFSRTVLEQGGPGWYKLQSLFAWARMWGAPIPLAYALQGSLIVALGVIVARLWRGAAPYALKAASLCLAAILATPYAFDYDMMVLAPAIAFFAADGLARGFRPWEKTALAALWLVPLVSRSIAHAVLIPLGVPAMLAVLVLAARRAERERGAPLAVLAVPPTAAPGRGAAAHRHDIAAFEP